MSNVCRSHVKLKRASQPNRPERVYMLQQKLNETGGELYVGVRGQ